MKIDVSFKNIDRSESLKTYVEEKSARLKPFFQGQIHLTWNFSVEHGEKIAHCHAVGNHMDYFGEATTPEFHSSVDLALDKIEKQIRKHKEKVTNHHHSE